MKYIVDNKEFEVIIEKKNNKNTYVRIKDDIKIYVTTSKFTTQSEVKRILDNNYSFLSKMIERKTLSNQRKEMFFYLGKTYDIIEVSIMDDIEIENDKIYTKNRTMLDRWYKKQIEKVFAQRYELMCKIFDENIIPPKLKIRTMKTRWGVYNKANHSITLNSHLIEYDIEKLDYVIIHELSHIIHFDHSKSFWQLVSKYCPNYKKIRKELKE